VSIPVLVGSPSKRTVEVFLDTWMRVGVVGPVEPVAAHFVVFLLPGLSPSESLFKALLSVAGFGCMRWKFLLPSLRCLTERPSKVQCFPLS